MSQSRFNFSLPPNPLGLASALGAAALTAGLTVTLAPMSASAFTLTSTGVTGITASDVGQSFTVNFDGNVEGTNVNGLSSTAQFTLTDFLYNSGQNYTEAYFTVLLDNTSSDGITSRTSVLGFNTDPNLRGVGSSNNIGDTRVTGIFDIDASGNLSNSPGSLSLEACFKDAGGTTNCSGGGNGGVSTNDTPGEFNPVLAFDGNVTSFSLDTFRVRYQSINGNGFNDASGTGRGTPVPEPTSMLGIMAFGALGGGRLLRKKKQQAAQ